MNGRGLILCLAVAAGAAGLLALAGNSRVSLQASSAAQQPVSLEGSPLADDVTADQVHQQAKDLANQTLHQNNYNQSASLALHPYPRTALDFGVR